MGEVDEWASHLIEQPETHCNLDSPLSANEERGLFAPETLLEIEGRWVSLSLQDRTVLPDPLHLQFPTFISSCSPIKYLTKKVLPKAVP